MKGQILEYSIQTHSGIISADDQNRYEFSGAEWRSHNAPQAGSRVDFEISAEGKAVQVFTSQGDSAPMQNYAQPLDQHQSELQFNMIDWYVKCLKNYANFTGRARRKEYWFFTLTYLIALILMIIIDSILGTNGILSAIFILAMIIPSLAVAVRRLHDIHKSGWYWLIQMIPIAGPIMVLVWLATETKADVNQWGYPAK